MCCVVVVVNICDVLWPWLCRMRLSFLCYPSFSLLVLSQPSSLLDKISCIFIPLLSLAVCLSRVFIFVKLLIYMLAFVGRRVLLLLLVHGLLVSNLELASLVDR